MTTQSSSNRKVCKTGHNRSHHHPYSKFTISRLTDELTLILSSKNDCDIFEYKYGQQYLYIFRPYQNQAEGLLYRINVGEYPPEFVIWEEDIPEELIRTLRKLGLVTMKMIVTEAVRRLYESVDSDYFHTNGLYNKIRWRFGKSAK